MKIKSVSGIVCYVTDLKQTMKFYKVLGFNFKEVAKFHAKGYINWFWIDFIAAGLEEKKEFKKEANAKNKGAGAFLYLSVDDVDKAYLEIKKKGYTPASPPRDWPWGNREFVVRDPDGYKLVIFKKL